MDESVQYLQQAFKDLVGSADWMEEKTKLKALEKLQHMKRHLAYPDWLTNTTAVHDYYREVRSWFYAKLLVIVYSAVHVAVFGVYNLTPFRVYLAESPGRFAFRKLRQLVSVGISEAIAEASTTSRPD